MLRKSKSIHEIYEEVKGYDLVITNDAPLATALNKLVDKPRLGYLAMTPKQIAKKFAGVYYEKIYDKFEIILTIYKQKRIPLNLIHQTVKKIYEIWMYNAKLEFVPHFLSEEENMLLKLLSEYETIESVMENFNENYYGNKKLAVIGEELFTLLDMEVLYKRGTPADKIELFRDEEFTIDKTYIFPAEEQLVNNLTNLINEENADETAIVLNTDSEYLEIIKSQLTKKGLKIEDNHYLKDDLSVRTIISFIELSFDIENVLLKEMIPLANEFDIKTQTKFNQYNAGVYIKSISKDKKLRSLLEVCKDIRKYTFRELVIKLKDNYEYKINPVFLEMLSVSEFENVKITDEKLTDLKYILKEFDIETDSEKSGIIFVNAMNSAFIDRKLVFYIGLDDSWMRLYPEKDYLKKEEEEEKDRLRFQILIQQGESKYYFVLDTIDYEKVIPCYYFSILSGKNADSFTDEFFNPVFINERAEKEIYKPVKGKISVKPVVRLEDISPSSLNAFFKCPKYYSFGRLLPNEENFNMKKGTLLHCFAELYFNHPEFAVKNFSDILDYMVKEISYFSKNINADFVKSDFRIGAESIINFLEEAQIKKTAAESSSGRSGNIIMEAFNLKKKYSNTEKWIRGNENSPVKGKMDLQYSNVIVDYKSSASKKNETEVTHQSNIKYIFKNETDNFDFQAIAYISHLRKESAEVEFIYNFLLSNFRNQVNDSAKPIDCLTKIKYLDVEFLEYIRQDSFFEMLLSDEKTAKLPEKIGKENFLYILDNLNLEESEYFDKELLKNRFIETANSVLEECNLSYKDFNRKKQDTLNSKELEPVAVKIFNLRDGKSGYGMLFKSDCDAFIELANKIISEINLYNKTKYPFEPIFGSRDICKKCDYLNLCPGNKLWH